jgi:hypothetical protein
MTTYEVRFGTSWFWLTGSTTVPGDFSDIRFMTFGNGVAKEVSPSQVNGDSATYRAPTANLNYVQRGTLTYLDPPPLIDMVYDVLGRRDVGVADAGSWVDVQASNLSPVDPKAMLQFYSPATGNAFNVLPSIDAGATFGTVSFGPTTALIRADKGDMAWVSQYVHGTVAHVSADGGLSGPSFDVQVLAKSARLDALTMQSGAHVAVPGSFSSSTVLEQTFVLDTDAWAALVKAVPPALPKVDETLYFSVTPYAASGIIAGASADLVVAETTIDSPSNAASTLSLTFADPFPSDWTPYADLRTCYAGPSSTVPSYSTRVCAQSIRRVTQASQTIAPALGPPLDVKLDGVTPSEGLRLKSLTPTLSWRPPSLGVPDRYYVSVFDIISSTQAKRVAGYLTRSPHVGIFTNVLVSGHRYVFIVTAEKNNPSWVYSVSFTSDHTPTFTPVVIAP